MKTFLTTITAILLFSLACKAQNNTFPTPAGNVGIGTTSPTEKLVVQDDSNDLIARFQNTTNGTTVKGFRLNAKNASGVNTYFDIAVDATNGAIGFGIGANGAALPIGQSDLTRAKLLILNSGNVGIGTTTPDTRLTVNGTVHSKSVVVDNNIFADYVFNKTYALRPLSAVKTYIDLNHHLPEIPSAAEVAKNGQNLGEMNVLLLKKVEELTLYMIELNKTVKEQQKEIEQLKNKN